MKELPNGWKNVQIGDVCLVKGGKRIPMGETFSSARTEHPYLRVTDMVNKSIKISSLKYVSNEVFESIKRYTISKNDVYITIAGTIGLSGIIPAMLDGASLTENAAKLVIKDSSVLNKMYLAYVLSLPICQAQIKKRTNAVGVPKLALFRIETIEIPLPPLPIQEKIVSILEKVEETKKFRAEADKLTQKLLQSVFLEMFGDLVENPKRWDVKRIGDVAEVKTGGTPSRDIGEYWLNGTLPWVKTTEIRENLIYDTEEYITELGFQNSNATLLPQNSILIAMYGQGKTRGRTAKLGIQATTNQACAAILPSDEYESDFLWTFLRLSYEALRNLGRGGNQPNLNLSMIKNFKAYFPPIDNQKRFSEIFNNIEKTKHFQHQSSLEIDTLFDALMQKAFKGELVC